ncbi:cell surface A33 antigen, partial [Silurus asotus]
FFFFFSFTVIHLVSSLNVDIPNSKYEFARGGDAVIPCFFKPLKPTNPSIIITWTAHADNSEDADLDILTYYHFSSTTPQLDINEDYNKRASFLPDIPNGWANLSLTSLTSKDSRVFQCEVKIPSDTQGKQADTTSLVVLVAPSKPICTIQGTAEFYQNINLTCVSMEGTPTPIYKWQRYDVSNNPKDYPPKATDVNGVLSLYNISADTSGYYVCTSSNKIRSETCNLTLSVMPYSMKLGSTAGIIGGCAAGLIILIVVACCCYHRRKKGKHVEYPMGSQEHVEYTDVDPQKIEMREERHVEGKADMRDEREEGSEPYDDRRDRDKLQSRPDNRQYDPERYDDRRSDRYDDRRSDRYDDRHSDRNDDQRSDRYDDRRGDRYDDRRSDYDDRRSDYDDRRSDRYDDRRGDRYDDRRRDRLDDRSRPPIVPANKP